jgi:predicted sulfurtransferase
MSRRLSVSLFIAVFILSCAAVIRAADKTPEQLVIEAKAQAEGVSIHDLNKLIESGEKVVILDVREDKEFKKGHIPGAIHISRGVLEFIVQDRIPDRNSLIVVY